MHLTLRGSSISKMVNIRLLKTIPALILFILSSFIYCQKTLNIDKQIYSTTGGKYATIKVTPEYFIIEIQPYYWDAGYQYVSYDDIYVGKFVPLKIDGYTLGTQHEKRENFYVYVPRRYKTLIIEGANKFGQNTTLDLTPYDEYVKARTGRKGLDDSEKPKVYLNYPKLTNNFYRTEELFITLEGKATDNMGLMSMMVNGQKVKVSDDGFYKKRLKLKLGKNTVILKAEDINNNAITYDFVIIRDELIQDTEFSDVDYPKATSNKNSNAFAVVFGIESYRNAPSVSNAVNDADIFREYLIKRFGLNRENIYLRLDEQATKGEFDKVFSSNGWLYRNTNKKSDVFIYYAGHGAPDVKTKETFLVPYDGDPNYASSTGFSINELYENLSDLNVKSITLMMDACFTGSSRDNQPILADARPVYIDVQQGNIPSNMIVFTASSGNEISSGYSEKNHGIFTYYLLKGLNGNADTNRDKNITVNEMSNYLSENVPQQARKIGRDQNPQLLGSDKNRILLAY